MDKNRVKALGDDVIKKSLELRALDGHAKKSSTYKARVMCWICGWTGTLELVKVTRVEGTLCPNCECKLGEDD